jgi:hypothetical protein
MTQQEENITTTPDLPSLGQWWQDGHTPEGTWRIDGVGLTTGTIYLTFYMRGEMTKLVMEWPRDRWRTWVERQLATLRDDG